MNGEFWGNWPEEKFKGIDFTATDIQRVLSKALAAICEAWSGFDVKGDCGCNPGDNVGSGDIWWNAAIPFKDLDELVSEEFSKKLCGSLAKVAAAFATLLPYRVSVNSISAYHAKRLEFLERVRAQSDKKMEQEDVRKAELAWLIGIHIYGIFDTYGIWFNNNRRTTEYRDMKTALLWGLLPGGGQIFNHDYGKAGLVYMGLLGAIASVSTSQNMVKYYLDRKHLVEKEDPKSEEYERITERVTYYRKNRNTYIWGGVLIYLYSIADAAVDALLSDFDSPLHMALLPNFSGGAQAVMSLDF